MAVASTPIPAKTTTAIQKIGRFGSQSNMTPGDPNHLRRPRRGLAAPRWPHDEIAEAGGAPALRARLRDRRPPVHGAPEVPRSVRYSPSAVATGAREVEPTTGKRRPDPAARPGTALRDSDRR